MTSAHLGVLFLDELAEFPGAVLDNLRQPLEEGRVVVCRASATVAFPARFMLVAAMNACRCGADGSAGSCGCPPASRARYVGRISGPLLDRFDLRVRVRRPDVEDLLGVTTGASPPSAHEPSMVVAARVAHARASWRGSGAPGPTRSCRPLPSKGTALSARVPGACSSAACVKGAFPPRGLHRVHRVALTVADLAGADLAGDGSKLARSTY